MSSPMLFQLTWVLIFLVFSEVLDYGVIDRSQYLPAVQRALFMNDIHNKVASSGLGHSKWQTFAFSMPSIGLAFFIGPLGVVQGVYAKYYGVALTTMAVVLLVGRIFDAVTDPLIGYYSDRYRANRGTRKPFLLVGGLCLIPCSFFLFIPSAEVSVAYLTFWSLLFYLALTVIQIPMYAWASELRSDSADRTMLFTVLAFVSQAGGLLFFVIPFFTTSEITPETFRVSVVFGAILLLLGLGCALKYVPNGPPPLLAESRKTDRTHQPKMSVFKDIYNAVKGNKPFQVFILANLCYGLGLGMSMGLFFIFVDAFLGRGEVFATLSIVGIVASLLVTPFIYRFALLVGKKRVWLIAGATVFGGILYIGLLSPDEDVFVELAILYVMILLGANCSGVIGMPMLSDTIDYGLLSDKTERRGTYFAIYTLMVKAQIALGLSLGLGIAGWLGFDATATTHDEGSAFAIHMAISWIPAVILTIGLFFIWRYPLDEHRCAIIARRLQRRETGVR